jgi:hypothetical protein
MGQRSSASPWMISVGVRTWWAKVDGEWAAYHARSSCGAPPYSSAQKTWPMSLVPYIDSRSKQGAPQTAAWKRSVRPIVHAVM